MGSGLPFRSALFRTRNTSGVNARLGGPKGAPLQQPVYVPSPGRPSNIKTVQSPMNNNYSPHTNFSMGPPQSSLMQQPVMTGRIVNDSNRNSSFMT